MISVLRAHFFRRSAVYLVPVFFFSLVAVLYRTIWQGAAGFGWDRVDSYWPDLAFLSHQFSRLDFPLWNPYERAGYPVHADPQPGVFYPVRWLLAGVCALAGGTSWWVAQFEELLNDTLMASFMYAFLRSRHLPRAAALFGGAATILSGTWIVDKTNNLPASMAWTPLIWLAIDAVLEQPGVRRAVALAAALYMAASAGSPPGYFSTLLMVGTYGAFRLTAKIITVLGSRSGASGESTGHSRLVQLRTLGASLGVAGAVTIASQAMLHLPGLELSRLSNRAVQFRDLSYTLDGFIGWQHSLVGLVAPTAGTAITYAGLIAVLCAVLAATIGWRRDAGAAPFFVVTSVFFLVLALGSQTPVLKWFVLHVPGFDLFRVPARFRTPFGILLTAASGYGMALLLDPGSRRRARQILTTAVLTAAFCGVVVWVLKTFPSWHTDMPAPQRSYWLLGISVALTMTIWWLPRSWGHLGALLALPLLYADAHGFMHHRTFGFQPRPHDAPGLAEIKDLPGLREYRVFDEFLLEPRSGSRLLLREMRGYQSFDPLATMAYRNVMTAARQKPEMLAEYNVRYVTHSAHYRMGWSESIFSAPPSIMAPASFRQLSGSVFEAYHAAPWVAWYGGVKAVPGGEIATSVSGLRDPSGVRRAAVVDAALLQDHVLGPSLTPLVTNLAEGRTPPSVAGRVTRFETETVSANVEAPSPGVVILNEAHYSGWRVWLDGREAPSFEADGLLRALLVPAGRHDITWRYQPRHWWWLRGLWWIGLACFAAAAFAPRLSRIRQALPRDGAASHNRSSDNR